MSLHSVYNNPSVPLGLVTTKNRASHRTRVSSVLVRTCSDDQSRDESLEPKKNSRRAKPSQLSNTFLSQPNAVGIIGGVSALSTLVFLEKLVWWGARCGGFCPPFVVCSDSTFGESVRFESRVDRTSGGTRLSPAVESLKSKRAFLEESGASCVVMPCHWLHVWHNEISQGSSLPFLHVGECVANELCKANLKPLEVGSSNVKIGLLASNEPLVTKVYKEKLENQGFEVVFPDKSTKENIVIPSMEALKCGDVKGARNLLKVALQILLMRAVNTVIITSDEMLGLLPHDDPLLKKCTDPMDALARSTLKWAKSKEGS